MAMVFFLYCGSVMNPTLVMPARWTAYITRPTDSKSLLPSPRI
jgi:hypothetical protein